MEENNMEEYNNGELTFKMIWQKIKVSGVRMIVYSLIAVIIVGGILGVCDIFVSKSQYETNITYYYSGIEIGNDPWGGREDVVGDIQSANNVSSALQNLEYSEEDIDALVNPIIRNLNIIASVDNEIKDEAGTTLSANYSYRIVLSQDSTIDSHLKSKNDYNNILNSITTTYINNFKSKYSFATSLTKLTAIDNYNYFQKYNAIKVYMNMLKEEASTWANKAPNFVSTSQNISFASLNARVEGVSLKLESYLNHILFNGIDEKGESEYIELKLQEATDLITIYDEEISKYNDVLSTIMKNPDAGVSGSGTIIVTPPDVESLTEAISLAVENKRIAQTEKNIWTNYKTYFATQDYEGKTQDQKNALKNTAVELEGQVLTDFNNVIDIYKSMIDEYNNGYIVSSLVRMTSVPKQTNNSPLTLKIGLIVELVTILLAIMVAMLVTSKKGSMKLKRKKDFEAQAEMVLIENSQNSEQADDSKSLPQTHEITGEVASQEDADESQQ